MKLMKILLPSSARQQGFTLIELMVTVGVAAVLLTVAVPAFNSIVSSNRLSGYANTFVASAQLARSEAIKRNADVHLCRSSDGSTCATTGSWKQGWIVLYKHPSDATKNVVAQHQQALVNGIDMTGNTYELVFKATGAGTTVATIKICPQPYTSDGQGRDLAVSATGKASVSTTKTGVCITPP